MCRSSLALYTWCHCQEALLTEPCHSGRISPSGSCDSVAASETVRLHCYCRYHAEKGFLSAHKENKKVKKAEKKEKRRSMGAASTASSVESFASDSSSTSSTSKPWSPGHRLRKSWASLRRLSFER